MQVFADSYAQRAGVQKDDLIVQVDGNRVDTCDVFLQVRSYREEGEERKGEERALSGWKDSRMSVQQHDCSTIPADFIIKMDNLIIKLLQSSVVGMDPVPCLLFSNAH